MRRLPACSMAILNYLFPVYRLNPISTIYIFPDIEEVSNLCWYLHLEIGGHQLLFTFLLPGESPVCVHILCHCRRVCILCPPLAWARLWVSMLLSNSRVPIVRQQRWIISSDKLACTHQAGYTLNHWRFVSGPYFPRIPGHIQDQHICRF